MSRKQPSRASKSVALAFLSEDKLQAQAFQSTEENDEIPAVEVKQFIAKKSKSKLRNSGDIEDIGVSTPGEVSTRALKQVVSVYGDYHDLYYADNGEKFNSEGW